MQLKERKNKLLMLDGVKVHVAPGFVNDIQCVGADGNLFSVLDPSNGQEEVLKSDNEKRFNLQVETNPKVKMFY